MKEQFSRTELLLGEKPLLRLQKSRVLLFGVGGVGGYCAEALSRAGVGSLTVVDGDTVSESNINRQIIALHSTVGKAKVAVLKARLEDINPDIQIRADNCFYTAENAGEYDFSAYDYVIDAIDTVSAKLLIIEKATAANVPVISCMGAGNKLDPARFCVTDIYQTEACPLARVMRRELRKRGICALKVVYSGERPVKTGEAGGRVPGSISFVPASAGLLLAGTVIKDLCKEFTAISFP